MTPSARIKVLIVENIPQMIKNLEKLFNLLTDIEVVGYVSTGQEATEKIKESTPDVALIDVNLPDISGLNLIEPIQRDFPITQVIIISQDKDYNIMLRAMRNGASDFLTHDVSLEDLGPALKRAAEKAAAEKIKVQAGISTGKGTLEPTMTEWSKQTGKIISVYSPKGGTGVTSLAVNLAIALQDKDSIVAVVDGSLQYGDVPVFINELGKFSMLDLVPRVHALDAKIVEDVMVFHKSSGLHILPAPPRPELAEQISGNQFSEILEFMRQMFSYVIVNTSSFISDPCLAALDASDVIVLLTTQEIAAIRSTRSFLHLWDGLDMSPNRVLIVLNRYDKQRNITPEKISDSLKHPIIETIPPDVETFFRAANLGIPFMLEKTDSLAAKSILSIAEQVREKIKEVRKEDRIRLFGAV